MPSTQPSAMLSLSFLYRNERGVILAVGLMVLVAVTILGSTAMLITSTDIKIGGNYKTRLQAFYIAEGGLQHGKQELGAADGTNDFSTVFGAAGTTTLFSNTSLGPGSYTVTAQAIAGSDPNRIRVTSSACVPAANPCPSGNTKVAIDAQFTLVSGRPNNAVTTGGDLQLNGNPNILGLCGGAHTNDDLQVAGNPGIQLANGLSASNSAADGGANGIDISGNPCVGSPDCALPSGQQPAANQIDTAAERDTYETANGSVAAVTLPTINPAQYAPLVVGLGGSGPAGPGYILHDDCNLGGTGVTIGGTCGADGLCIGGTSVAVPAGWSCSGSTWTVSGSTAANGIFYAEGEVKVSGSPGSDASPWQVTIIARDSIEISGNPDLKPYPTTTDALKNTLLVTGNDLKISGNPEADYAGGAILVHQQFEISGNPEISGFIISGDGQPTWTGDPFPNASSGVTTNKINGNPTITYDCGFGCTGPPCPPPTVSMVTGTWREAF